MQPRGVDAGARRIISWAMQEVDALAAGRAFFDRVADSWDDMACHPPERVASVLTQIGVGRGERVLDVGCGTGVLEPGLSAAVGGSGSVLAVDLSPRMIAVAIERRKLPNVAYRVADFLGLDPDAAACAGGFDLVVAYSAFPHFFDRGAFFEKAASLLAQGGKLAIAHIEGREAINAFHDAGGPPSLALPPVAELATLARQAGLEPILERDDDYYILVAGLNRKRA